MEKWISILKSELLKSLPGPSAQQKMSPSLLRLPDSDLPARRGSVMILLYKKQEGFCTVFIKRAENNGVHSGQISLPGGMHESTDHSLIGTALRETEEETGVAVDLITVLGQLTGLHIPVSNVDVLPVVAVLKDQPVFIPDANEVEFIIEASINELIDPANRKKKMITLGDFEIEAPYYNVQGTHIWGATAMILSEFLELVERVDKLVKL